MNKKQVSGEKAAKKYKIKLFVYIAIAAAALVWLYLFLIAYVADEGAPYLFAAMAVLDIFLLFVYLKRRINAIDYILYADCNAHEAAIAYEILAKDAKNKGTMECGIYQSAILAGKEANMPIPQSKKEAKRIAQTFLDEFSTELNHEKLKERYEIIKRFGDEVKEEAKRAEDILEANGNLSRLEGYYKGELQAPYTYRRVLACYVLGNIRELYQNFEEAKELFGVVAEAGGTLKVKELSEKKLKELEGK